jgi:hypothetical protein
MKRLAALIATLSKTQANPELLREMVHAFHDLERNEVCPDADKTLTNLLGKDWNLKPEAQEQGCGGCESCDCDGDEDGEDDGLSIDEDIAITIEKAYEESDSAGDVIVALAAALQIAAKELGWKHTSTAAHHIWFEA